MIVPASNNFRTYQFTFSFAIELTAISCTLDTATIPIQITEKLKDFKYLYVLAIQYVFVPSSL